MKKKIQYCLLVAVLLAATPAAAQTTNTKSVDVLKMLFQFKGNWQAPKAVLQSGSKKQTFVYTANFKTASANNGLIMYESANLPGMGKLDATNLLGVNPYDEKVHWFTVDNMGTTHEHIGEFTDSKHFTMIYKGVQEGKEYIETVAVEFAGKDALNLKVTATLDGKEVEAITGTFYRKKTS